nr:immunoglobulin heavy chain junction region [Macaca mulatta]MOV88453.1 immunoglobulin heavy chain junction region [Macaca mulatta]MOV89307.1 immunoglobulin heavy chain junction region [Macaca mulatta]
CARAQRGAIGTLRYFAFW